MKYDIDSLLRDKNLRSVEIDCLLDEPPPETAGGLGFDSAGAAALRGTLRLDGELPALRVMASMPYAARCARCDAEIKGTLEALVEGPVVDVNSLEDKLSDDYITTEGGILDLSLIAAQALILAAPSKLLCDEGCLGLCPQCGADLNRGKCVCPPKATDPRLAALDRFFDK